MKKNIYMLSTGFLAVNTYVVPLVDNKVFVVDPAACKEAGDSMKIVDFLKNKKLECIAVVLTHSHFDHITGIDEILTAFPNIKIAMCNLEAQEVGAGMLGPINSGILNLFGMEIIIPAVIRQPAANVFLKDGDSLENLGLGALSLSNEFAKWKVLHTPGHSPGSICLYNEEEALLISGDTLFDGAYGRTDFYGGSEKILMESSQYLKNKIPSGVKVYPGHDNFGFNF